MAKIPSYDNVKAVTAIAVVGVVGYLAYRVYKVGADVVTKDLNPMNPDNVVNKAVTGVAEKALAGNSPTAAGKNADGSWSLGGYLFDIFNRDASAARDSVASGPAPAARAITYPKGGNQTDNIISRM